MNQSLDQMVRIKRRLSLLLLGSLMAMLVVAGIYPQTTQAASAPATSNNDGSVYVIPIDRQIESGLQKFLARGFEEAKQAKASWIVLEMNTPGGELQAAGDIGAMVRNSDVPVAVFVQDKAASAGSYIALNADKIFMQPGSTIGAAAIVDGQGNPIDNPKQVAYWKSEMRAAAQLHNRNADIADGMTDVNMVVPMPEINKTKEKGQIISLSSNEALKVGFADDILASTNAVVAELGHSPADIVQVQPSAGENIARVLTNPIVTTLLLFIGIAGIAIEIIIPGFGIPGIVGIVAFALYFFGSYAAGFSGSTTWLLFLGGLILLVLELFIPSFGILGILGSASLITGVVKAAYDTSDALLSLGIAFASAAVVVTLIAILLKERGVWNRFILKEQLSSEQSFMSRLTREQFLGKEGTSVTPLRPSGTVMIEGERIDVVTQGNFIANDRPIRVKQVDGSRIIVEEIVEEPSSLDAHLIKE
ncbi:NfeD family protein [Paenibacillus kyungheensis]